MSPRWFDWRDKWLDGAGGARQAGKRGRLAANSVRKKSWAGKVERENELDFVAWMAGLAEGCGQERSCCGHELAELAATMA